MTTTPPKPGSATTPASQLEIQRMLERDPDLVDRIFEYLLTEFPQIAGPSLDATKRAVRAEFQGEEIYIPVHGASARQERVAEVLAMFNGRNASEVARRLKIGRSTVYRILKQAGRRGRN